MNASRPSHLLPIRHTTCCEYNTPVEFEPHRLVLRPREGHDLRVENLELSLSPGATVIWIREIFGNSIAHAHFSGPHQELVVDSDVTVRRFFDPEFPPGISHSASTHPLAYDPLESGHPHRLSHPRLS